MLSQYQQTCDPFSKVKLTKTCITKKIARGKEEAHEGVGERGAGKKLKESFCYRRQGRKSNLEQIRTEHRAKPKCSIVLCLNSEIFLLASLKAQLPYFFPPQSQEGEGLSGEVHWT